jgi:predicted ATPase
MKRTETAAAGGWTGPRWRHQEDGRATTTCSSDHRHVADALSVDPAAAAPRGGASPSGGAAVEVAPVTGAEHRRRRMSSRRTSACLYSHDVECLEWAVGAHQRRDNISNNNSNNEDPQEGSRGDVNILLSDGERISKRNSKDTKHPHERSGHAIHDRDKKNASPPAASNENLQDSSERGGQLLAAKVTQPVKGETCKSHSSRRSSEASISDSDVQLLRSCLEEGASIGIFDSNEVAATPTNVTRTVLHAEALERLQKALASVQSVEATPNELSPHSIPERMREPPPSAVVHVVVGAQGSGKTRLARLAAMQNGSVLIRGRSEPITSPNHPYRAFVLAAAEWCHIAIQSLPPDAIPELRLVLLRDLEQFMDWNEDDDDRQSDLRVLTTVIPELAPIILGNLNVHSPVASHQPNESSNDGGSNGTLVPGRRASVSASIAAATSADGRGGSQQGHDVNHRFTMLLRTFLRTVLSYPLEGRPVVLLLDDAHWLDRASMDLLASILTGEAYGDDDNDNSHQSSLKVILSVRNDDPSLFDSSECWLRLSEWSSSPEVSPTSVSVARYELAPLTADSVGKWLSQALNMDAIERTSHFGSVIHRFTQGNPGEIVNMCSYLQEIRVLHLDRTSCQWSWNVDEMNLSLSSVSRDSECPPSDSILSMRLGLVHQEVTDVLKVAACLGPSVDNQFLTLLFGLQVSQPLATAVERGYLVERQANDYETNPALCRGVRYEFESEHLHLACYRLVRQEERARLHLSVGQTVWNTLADDASLETYLFTILCQLFLSMDVLEEGRFGDKEVAASLCLHGGIRAAMSSSFRIASTYLGMGIHLVGDQGWEMSYELTLALHNTAAEMAMCDSDHSSVEKRVDAVICHAESPSDTFPVYATQMQSLCLRGKYGEARDLGVHKLRTLGEHFPSTITAMRLISLFVRVNRWLRSKSNEQILRIHEMEDKNKLACMRILHLMGTAVVNTTPEMVPYVGLKMVRLTLKHGLSPFSSFAFVMMGTLSQALYGDLAAALRFGQLGLRLCRRYGRKEFLPRVYGLYFGLTHVWSRPIHEVLVPLRRGFEIGLRTGDMEGAFICGRIYCMTSVETGVPLRVALRNFQRLCDAIQYSHHTGILPTVLCEIQAIHHMMGLSNDPRSPKGDVIDAAAALSEALAKGQYMSVYAIRMIRMKICYLFNDYEQAASVMVTDLRKSPPVFSHCVGVMIVGLVALAIARSRRSPRIAHTGLVRKVIKKLRRLSLQCPENVLDKLAVVQAELLSVQGRDAEAYERYVCALAVAEKLQAPFMVGLISERTSRHLMGVEDAAGIDRASSPESFRHLQQAVRSFSTMGADAKVRQLREEIRLRYRAQCDSP